MTKTNEDYQTDCYRCDGSGKIDGDTCPQCQGRGQVQREMFYGYRPTEEIKSAGVDLRAYVQSLEDSLFYTNLEYDQSLIRGMQKDREISELQEQIEEAREYVKNSDRSQIAPTANTDLLEILSPDSDEGDPPPK